MKQFHITLCSIATAFLFTATSCKKDKTTEVSCTIKSIRTPTSTVLLEYDASGFISTITDSASGTYSLHTASGTQLTAQSYTAADIPSGSPHQYIINSAGLIVLDIGFDSTFYTYNTNGQMIKQTTGAGTNITTAFTYEDDNVSAAVQYDGSGNIIHTINYDYYTNQENKSGLNFLVGFLADSRYGKPSKNLLRQVQSSNGGATIKYTNFSYDLDANGYITGYNQLNQPDNTYASVALSYNCN